MAGMGEEIRERTDALDAAGNTTAAIGKGFAIGSAALVSLALFGAYVTRAKISVRDSSILDPEVRLDINISSPCLTPFCSVDHVQFQLGMTLPLQVDPAKDSQRKRFCW